MKVIMRFLPLIVLAAALAGCAQGNNGISPGGGDAFVLETHGMSGSGAVEAGLAQAQSLCSEHGRLFVLTDSQVGSSSYRLAFRCIAVNNALPPPPMVARAPAPPPPRTGRARRATAAPEGLSTGTPLGYAASLPAMAAPPAPVFWSLGAANIPPPLPPVATTALFAPPAGTMLPVPPPSGPRLPPADNSSLVALPRLEGSGTAVQAPSLQAAAPSLVSNLPSSASPAILSRDALPPVSTLPLLQSQAATPGWAQPGASPSAAATRAAAVPTEFLPPVQAQPAAAARPLSAPPLSFGNVVPSPNPLPGASASLPPIAGGNTRPVPLPGGNVSGFSNNATGFTQGFR